MFIYTNYSTHGFEDPLTLVEECVRKGATSVCLIDEYGIGISSFLKACERFKLTCSIAFPFSMYCHGFDGKIEGYFAVNTFTSLSCVQRALSLFQEQALPFLSKDELNNLLTSGVHILYQNNKNHYQLFGDSVSFPIEPCFFSSEKQHDFFSSFKRDTQVITLTDDALLWLSSFSASPSTFRCADYFCSSETLDIFQFIDTSAFSEHELMQIHNECIHFTKFQMLPILYALSCAKQEGFQFIVHGDLYTSLLAFALSLTSQKPNHLGLFFDFSKKPNINVVVQKSSRFKFQLFMKRHFDTTHPVIRNKEPLGLLLHKAAAHLQLNCDFLLSQISKKDTLQQLKEKLRLHLLCSQDDAKIVSYADVFSRRGHKNLFVPDNQTFLFSSQSKHCVRAEEYVYIEKTQLEEGDIPYFSCYYPPQELQEMNLEYLSLPKHHYDKESLSLLYLKQIQKKYTDL